jgi:hypothetical protein
MPKLNKIVVIHTTAKNPANAASTAKFTLEIEKALPDREVTKRFENRCPSQMKERDPGVLDIYQFDVSRDNVDSDAEGFGINMSINSSGSPGDGWLPRSILVLGQATTGELIPLGDNYEWGDRWFDIGEDAAGPPAHKISW